MLCKSWNSRNLWKAFLPGSVKCVKYCDSWFSLMWNRLSTSPNKLNKYVTVPSLVELPSDGDVVGPDDGDQDRDLLHVLHRHRAARHPDRLQRPKSHFGEKLEFAEFKQPLSKTRSAFYSVMLRLRDNHNGGLWETWCGLHATPWGYSGGLGIWWKQIFDMSGHDTCDVPFNPFVSCIMVYMLSVCEGVIHFALALKFDTIYDLFV